MRKNVPRALALLLLLAAASAPAVSVPIPPAPTRWVTDNAHWLTDAERTALDGKLEAYEKKSGHQLLAWIGTTTGETPTEAWTVKAFEAWKVGRAKADDGLVLFVFSTDRKVRIEVGYGLEGRVPDATAARIIQDVITPRLKENRRADAVVEGVAALVAAVDGEVKQEASAPDAGVEASPLGPLPLPGSYLTNHSPMLVGSDAERLEQRLEQHARTTGQPLYVWVGPSIRGAGLDGWFEARQELRSGAVLLLGMDSPAEARVVYGPNLAGEAYGERSRRQLEAELVGLRKGGRPWEWPGLCADELYPKLGWKPRPGAQQDAVACFLGMILAAMLLLPPTVLLTLFRLLAELWRSSRGWLLSGLVLLVAGFAWSPVLGMLLVMLAVGVVRLSDDDGARSSWGGRRSSGSSSSGSRSSFSGGGGRSGGGGATGAW